MAGAPAPQPEQHDDASDDQDNAPKREAAFAIARRLARDGGTAAGAARLCFELRQPAVEFSKPGGHVGVASRRAIGLLPPLAICRVVAVSVNILGLARG